MCVHHSEGEQSEAIGWISHLLKDLRNHAYLLTACPLPPLLLCHSVDLYVRPHQRAGPRLCCLDTLFMYVRVDVCVRNTTKKERKKLSIFRCVQQIFLKKSQNYQREVQVDVCFSVNVQVCVVCVLRLHSVVPLIGWVCSILFKLCIRGNPWLSCRGEGKEEVMGIM